MSMDGCRKTVGAGSTFSSDFLLVHRTYEAAIAKLILSQFPLKVGYVINLKMRLDQNTFKGSSTQFLSDAFTQLRIDQNEISPEAELLSESIAKILSGVNCGEELVSIIVG